jgi:hypothetical protein
MSKSYSKIRHMQEANLMLERRIMSERRMLLEEDKKDGDIEASSRELAYIDGTEGTMTDAVFQVYNNGSMGKQYFYNCVAEKDTTPDQHVGTNKPGAMYDTNGTLTTPAQLGLIPGYQNKLSVACKPVYDYLAKWRKTFCANLKNKTKPNYAWNCPEAAKPVAAAAESPAAPVAPVEKGPTPTTPEQIAAIKNDDQKMLTDLTNFYNSRLLMLDKEDGTMKTDQELESDVITWNNYISARGGRIPGGDSYPKSMQMRSYFRRRISGFSKEKPNLKQPEGGFTVVSSL